MPAKLPPAERYARDVLTGRIIACRWVRKACQRHIDDLKHGAERGLVFDRKAAQRALDFFRILCHSKGEWAGQPVVLEPWQQFITWVIFGWKRAPHARWIVERNGQREDTAGTRRFRTAYIEIARKNGKALGLDTPIPTPDGWTTMGDIQIGDMVFDDQGKPCRVVRTTEIMNGRPCYRVVFSDKTEIIADADHQWKTERRRTGRPCGKRWRECDNIQTTKEILQTLKVGKHREWNHKIRCTQPLILVQKKLLIPPYILGAWLGDGHADSARITCSDKDKGIIDEISNNGMSVKKCKTHNSGSSLYLLGSGGKSQFARDNSMQAKLRKLGVLGSKKIPTVYLRASKEQRIELLCGLMDTDGYISKRGQCEFTTTNPSICSGFMELTRSLGYKPQCKIDRATLYGKDCGVKYRIQFFAFSDMPIFHLQRKYTKQKPIPIRPTRSSFRQIIAVEPVPSVPVRCIEVDSPSHLYLAGEGMIPTHNSTWAAGIMLYLSFADEVPGGEPGAECYTAATKRDQARIVHGEAVRMVRKSAVLRRNGVVTYKDNIHQVDHAQRFEPLGADSDTMDGLNIHAAVLDELHAHKTRAVWDVLETATGSRRQPLILAITTAGTNRQGVCYEKHEYTRRVLERIVEDDTWFGIIYTLDEKDDWRDEAVWINANPNLGVSKKWSDMRVKAERAKSMPSALNAFKQKELNCWVQGEIKWMPMDAWGKCTGPHLALDLPDVLAGHACYSGLDLSSIGDITALVHVFPPLVDDDPWYVVCRFWCPEDNLVARVEKDAVAYDVWQDEGYLTATPGNVIDYDWILDELEQDLEQFQILGIPYDRWNAEILRQTLIKRGLTTDIIEFGQGYQSMSPAMKELERLVLGGKLAHGNNPVLTWMADNLIAKSDPAGNIKPDKERSKEKIDGIVALIMGLGWALRNQGETGRSVYEDRGVVKV